MGLSVRSIAAASKALVSALPLLFIAGVYFLARISAEPVLGMDDDWLRRMVGIELLAIHSFPFVGLLSLLRPATPEFRGLKWLGVAFVTFLYFNAAHMFAGWHGLLAFISLAGVTYLGFLLNWTPIASAARLTARWVVNFFLFATAAVVVSIPADTNIWEDHATPLSLGVWYFAATGLVELTGFYQRSFWTPLGADARKSIESIFVRRADGTAGPFATVWRSLVPLAGAALVVAGPLIAAALLTSIAGRFIKGSFEWPDDDFLMQFWLPLLMTGILFALRAWHIVWMARVLHPGCRRRWWKRPGVVAALCLIAAMYLAAAADFREDATEVANYRAFVPQIVYASYTGEESLLALALVPLSWWTVTLATRRAREAPAIAAEAKPRSPARA